MIQIDMDMPTRCLDCPLWYISPMALEFKCILNKQTHDISFEMRDGERAEWCPLPTGKILRKEVDDGK